MTPLNRRSMAEHSRARRSYSVTLFDEHGCALDNSIMRWAPEFSRVQVQSSANDPLDQISI